MRKDQHVHDEVMNVALPGEPEHMIRCCECGALKHCCCDCPAFGGPEDEM